MGNGKPRPYNRENNTPPPKTTGNSTRRTTKETISRCIYRGPKCRRQMHQLWVFHQLFALQNSEICTSMLSYAMLQMLPVRASSHLLQAQGKVWQLRSGKSPNQRL